MEQENLSYTSGNNLWRRHLPFISIVSVLLWWQNLWRNVRSPPCHTVHNTLRKTFCTNAIKIMQCRFYDSWYIYIKRQYHAMRNLGNIKQKHMQYYTLCEIRHARLSRRHIFVQRRLNGRAPDFRATVLGSNPVGFLRRPRQTPPISRWGLPPGMWQHPRS